jgi:hypothetical protein
MESTNSTIAATRKTREMLESIKKLAEELIILCMMTDCRDCDCYIGDEKCLISGEFPGDWVLSMETKEED